MHAPSGTSPSPVRTCSNSSSSNDSSAEGSNCSSSSCGLIPQLSLLQELPLGPQLCLQQQLWNDETQCSSTDTTTSGVYRGKGSRKKGTSKISHSLNTQQSNPTPNHPVSNPFASPTQQTPIWNTQSLPIPTPTPSPSPTPTRTPTLTPIPTPTPTPTEEQGYRNPLHMGKLQIWPEGPGLFCAEHHPQVVRKITSIYKSKYDGAYTSWKKVPIGLRDLWFKDLKKYYWWEEKYEGAMRDCFEFRGKALYRDTLREVRKYAEQPDWIEEDFWKELCEYWELEAFLKKSSNAKTNGASTSGVGSSVHTGGSVPINVHRMKLIKEGVEPIVRKLFLQLHQTKDNKWVDDKAAKADENYAKKLKEVEASKMSIDGPDSQVLAYKPTYEEQMKIWVDANGLTKRGQLYGFGPQGNTYTNSSEPSVKYQPKTPLLANAITQLEEA